MDQTQTVDNDLQKAIDDITKTTSIDPVFSDPVAAPSSVPEGDTGELAEANGPFPEPVIKAPIAPEPVAPAPFEAPAAPAFEVPPVPSVPDLPPAPVFESPAPVIQVPEFEPLPQSLNTSEVKKAALRDLVPLLDKINMNSSQKFNIYKDIFDVLKDYTVLEPAYRAAREITDETERANALLYLVESIDKM
ncbi:hypothetical protein IJJ49_00970 [Candidatus Saccharibacteria bacterium]|nr:hypothetical protein [Candidatus Saccharibacteria bacterium]